MPWKPVETLAGRLDSRSTRWIASTASDSDTPGARLIEIVTDGSVDFALQDLSWQLDSSDATNYFDQVGDFSTADYSETRVGINYGGDNDPGTEDDLIYKNNESGSLPVHELYYVGIGDGFEVTTGDGPNHQEAVANLMRLAQQS